MPWSAKSIKLLAMALAPAVTGTPKIIPVAGETNVSSVIDANGSVGPEPSSFKSGIRPAIEVAQKGVMHALTFCNF